MKKIIGLVLAAAILLAMPGVIPAAANGRVEYSFSQQPGGTLMTGTISIGATEYPVAITVSVYDANNQLNYYDIVYTDTEGNASFSYINNGTSGTYSCYFNTGSGQTYLAQCDNFRGSEFWTEILKQVNQAATGNNLSELKHILTENSHLLGLDNTIYDSLKQPDQAYQIMLEEYPGYVEIAEVIRDYQRACYVQYAKENGIAGLKKLYADDKIYHYFDLSTSIPAGDNAGPVLDELSPATQDAVYRAVSDACSSSSQVIDGFVEQTLFTAIASAANYGEVQAVILAYCRANLIQAEEKNLSVGLYKALMGEKFGNYAEVEHAITSYRDSGSGNGSGGGNGGGNNGGGGNGSGAVRLPRGEASVVPQPQATSSEQQSGMMYFQDMEDSKWALEAVNYLMERGIVAGTGNAKFEPNRNVTRAELAKMLVSLVGEEVTEAPSPFVDVDSGAWYAGYVTAANNRGLLRGYEDNTFAPEGNVTRQEAAVAAARLFSGKTQKAEESQDFLFADDAQIGEWAKPSVYELYAQGIITGRTDSVFAPEETLTRAECAVLLYRAAISLEQ